MNRKEFLTSVIGATAFSAVSSSAYGDDIVAIKQMLHDVSRKTNGRLMGLKVEPIKKVKIGMIGLGNRGKVLAEMLHWLIKNDKAEVTALCDLNEKNITFVKEKIDKWQINSPAVYFKDENAWQHLARQDNIDLLVIATPWRWHAPMAIYGMNHGKHVAVEVPMTYTLNECWEVVEAAERTNKHCIMLENCCYNEEELFVLNMIENGVFGDITHTEGAYLHDLRAHLLSNDYYQDQWRIKHHLNRDGNLYVTHGLGPIGFYLHIGRGDTFDYLTSMSTRELNLSRAAKRVQSTYTDIKCGDMNTTLVKTKQGKTVMLQFDVHTGRPYSRINKVVGTQAVHDGYPSRLYVDKEKLSFGGHTWLSKEEYEAYKGKYTHPIVKKLKKISEEYKQGHGGMDFVMMYRLITCLNLGLPLDINVYDGVMWSAITPLSELSVASGSLPLPCPDFTGGRWEKPRALEIMREW